MLCGHGLCRGQPPQIRPGVAWLLSAAAALEPLAFEMQARCLDECRRPSLGAWRKAADAGAPSAQLFLAKLLHRSPGHEAAKESAKVFLALVSQRDASEQQRATAHLHLGFAYLDAIGIDAASDALAKEHLGKAVTLGRQCGDAEITADADEALTSLERSTFFANGA